MSAFKDEVKLYGSRWKGMSNPSSSDETNAITPSSPSRPADATNAATNTPSPKPASVTMPTNASPVEEETTPTKVKQREKNLKPPYALDFLSVLEGIFSKCHHSV